MSLSKSFRELKLKTFFEVFWAFHLSTYVTLNHLSTSKLIRLQGMRGYEVKWWKMEIMLIFFLFGSTSWRYSNFRYRSHFTTFTLVYFTPGDSHLLQEWRGRLVGPLFIFSSPINLAGGSVAWSRTKTKQSRSGICGGGLPARLISEYCAGKRESRALHAGPRGSDIA